MALQLPRLSKPTVFAALMVFSVILAMLPTSWTGRARGLSQPFGLLQWPIASLTRFAYRLGDFFDHEASTPDQFALLRSERDQLELQVGQQSLLIDSLRQQVNRLSSVRAQLRDDSVRIVVAPVLGYDGSTRRSAMTIGRGSRDGLRVSDWVVAGDAAPAEELLSRDVLLRQWVVGQVAEVSPYQARVRICVDPEFRRVPVRVAKRQDDGNWLAAPAEGLLSGIGHDRMQIQKTTFDYQNQGYTIVLVPVAEQAAGFLVIGEIIQTRALPESALHFDCDVRPWGDYRRLTQVFVATRGD